MNCRDINVFADSQQFVDMDCSDGAVTDRLYLLDDAIFRRAAVDDELDSGSARKNFENGGEEVSISE